MPVSNHPKIRVAVIRGGPSSVYEDSLKTGDYVLKALRKMHDEYEPLDIFISKDEEWHREGLVKEPHQALREVDIVWNALHGKYGESGQAQRILENLQIPFTGSNAATSALSLDKALTKHLYQRHSLLTPAHELITERNLNDDLLINIFRNYLHPVIVKPADGSGSIGICLAHTFFELMKAIKDTFKLSPRVVVEEFIQGDEISCTVIEEAKGEQLYALLPLSKSGKLKMEENRAVEEMAKQAHGLLKLRHYSNSDFLITPRTRKVYILETNSLPVLHEDSLTHHSLLATGWHFCDFVDHILKLAK
ncbi:MAG: ATP-grasp domain-containing protein [Candidatus Zambryskibacteria bacterium]|nr:ATP-grasp domain-containing protein [Candidatus Zambryskibacteria bacterium]